jgi:acetyltransferase-like isoleucine patch superfamily enzyme
MQHWLSLNYAWQFGRKYPEWAYENIVPGVLFEELLLSDRRDQPYFAHESAFVDEPSTIGEGTRIWHYVVVLPGAVIGRDGNICSHCFIENKVVVGDRVTVKCGVQLWDGVTLEDDVFVGPNVTFTNDLQPRSRNAAAKLLPTLVRKGASIGANSTILPGITIGEGAMVGAGAVVTKDVPPGVTVVGNPARVVS